VIGVDRPGLKSVTRNDVRNGKPDPEPFLRAAWLTGIDPAETYVVEDSHAGAAAGVAAGMRTLFWPQEPMTTPSGAIHVYSVDELRSRLGVD
jgi:beta-phosphoglucomutase-like phosphatase (HAD superfamily)